jgi:hypothetical protein
MKTRPVFESYEEFVYAIKNAIYEAETGEGSIDALNKLLGGGLKMANTDLKNLKIIVDGMNTMMTTAAAEEFKEWAQNISDYFSKGEEGVKPSTGNVALVNTLDSFDWLVNGTVRVKGEPRMNDTGNGGLYGTGFREDDTSINTPISDILRGIFAYNLQVLSEIVDKAKSSGKEKTWKQSNGGKKGTGKFEGFSPFLSIDENSLKGDIIQVVPYTGAVGGKSAYEYGFIFPVYTVYKISKGSGKALGTETYEEVIKPAGNSEEIIDKPYNSSGVDFFAENAVVIGKDGIAALKSIISEFNSITTIKVNGGASSKPTSRAGGNEQLAKDRQAAGIKALQDLQKAGVEQLKGTKIEAGEAKVQDAAEESDPKNQQVSFIISGNIKTVTGTDNKETIIRTVNNLKADRLQLRQYNIYLVFNIA